MREQVGKKNFCVRLRQNDNISKVRTFKKQMIVKIVMEGEAWEGFSVGGW